MELNHKSGRLIVQYSGQTVSLLREVRILAGMGHRIPARLQKAALLANKFYKHAVVLKQVFIFHMEIYLSK